MLDLLRRIVKVIFALSATYLRLNTVSIFAMLRNLTLSLFVIFAHKRNLSRIDLIGMRYSLSNSPVYLVVWSKLAYLTGRLQWNSLFRRTDEYIYKLQIPSLYLLLMIY